MGNIIFISGRESRVAIDELKRPDIFGSAILYRYLKTESESRCVVDGYEELYGNAGDEFTRGVEGHVPWSGIDGKGIVAARICARPIISRCPITIAWCSGPFGWCPTTIYQNRCGKDQEKKDDTKEIDERTKCSHYDYQRWKGTGDRAGSYLKYRPHE